MTARNWAPRPSWWAPIIATRQPAFLLGPEDKVRVVPVPEAVWNLRSRNGATIPTNPYKGMDYYDDIPNRRTYGRMAYAFDRNGRSSTTW